MLTQESHPSGLSSRTLRRRMLGNAALGVVGSAWGAVLIYPKVLALAAGSLDALGIGAIANLALLFGSLMFLREAQRARALLQPRPNGEL